MDDQPGCATCKLRASYDSNSRSLIGRLWRWHIKFCPGWKKYVNSLNDAERAALQERYSLGK